ncbi:MAG: NAD(P)H-dependent glycerol-3-phosphate dehydrogenase [Cyanobacteria bacterium J06638_7]
MPRPQSLRITVLGCGAWGGTLAELWQRQGHELRCWSRRQGGDPAAALAEADLGVVAVPMAAVAHLAGSIAGRWPPALPLLSCSKGIDLDRQTTASRIWSDHGLEAPLLVLSGPNLATELAQGLPAASVLASRQEAVAAWLQPLLSGASLRLYTNDDPVGTEVAGALKNVMAVAAGLCDGLRLGANARASLLTRGLAETGIVLEAFGGSPATLYGLAGLGDMLATATSPLSRNYRCGQLLAEGLTVEAAMARIEATVEGPRTARATLALARMRGLKLPICEQVVGVIEGRCTPGTAARALMQRQLRPEGQQVQP